MNIEKTRAVILTLLPYRETSSIVKLYSEKHGLIHGIAKGIRRNNKGAVPIERGHQIELVVYVKPNRDLHTLADIQIIDFYPSIRQNLQKSAIRDAAFELILRSVHQNEPHPEIFESLLLYQSALELPATKENTFSLLWKFHLGITDLLGFGIQYNTCVKCGRDILDSGGYLGIQQGGMFCKSCAATTGLNDTFLDKDTIRVLCDKEIFLNHIPYRELMRISRIITAYCRFHLDIKQDFKTMQFLAEMEQ
ncbi:MAG: DNA repair protein RecO [Fibrobacter sp.]|nr:DNA repair protein RecO [Fibrobacter sp.]